VLELLVHHGLDDKVPFPIDKSEVLVERWLKPDPRTEKARADYAKASNIMHSAMNDYTRGRFLESVKHCDEALEVLPEFAPALYYRSGAAQAYVWREDPNREAALKVLKLAYEDAVKCARAVPSEPKYLVQVSRVLTNIASKSGSSDPYQDAQAIIDDVLTSKNLPDETRADALTVRAFVHEMKGNTDEALADYDEAIRLWPQYHTAYESRARLHAARGRDDLAAADRAQAKKAHAWLRTGLKIITVVDSGAAGGAGLREGDIILKVGPQRVHNREELSSALATAKGPVDVVFYRDGEREVLSVTPEDGKLGVAFEPAVVE